MKFAVSERMAKASATIIKSERARRADRGESLGKDLRKLFDLNNREVVANQIACMRKRNSSLSAAMSGKRFENDLVSRSNAGKPPPARFRPYCGLGRIAAICGLRRCVIP